ncbi:hypothetical protein [Trinickia mobilis]|uniref:hypothetical protein n=1 Tax=Trinickia mobilis TaxID=2816356 RepID=UPI001A8C37CC|nr:hypothetical protein [Trinickia mobilis]
MIISLKRLGTVKNGWLFPEPVGLRSCKYKHLFSRDKAAQNELCGGVCPNNSELRIRLRAPPGSSARSCRYARCAPFIAAAA